jgi:hypothetical protein
MGRPLKPRVDAGTGLVVLALGAYHLPSLFEQSAGEFRGDEPA